ncbi:hypothetical protein AALT_g11264 [Alternaria alternata]|jgi:hypothetical protein|nr:hypothetical protein AALT_g11264 [Alternaria alternata]
MVVVTALRAGLALLTVSTLLVFPTDVVTRIELEVPELTPVRALLIATWLEFLLWYCVLHWNDEVAQLDGDNGQEEARSEEGIDEATSVLAQRKIGEMIMESLQLLKDPVLDYIVRDDEAEANNTRGEEEVDGGANEPGVFERRINEDPDREMFTDDGREASHNNKVEDIVMDADAGPRILTVTVAAAATVHIKVRVEATEGIHDRV